MLSAPYRGAQALLWTLYDKTLSRQRDFNRDKVCRAVPAKEIARLHFLYFLFLFFLFFFRSNGKPRTSFTG